TDESPIMLSLGYARPSIMQQILPGKPKFTEKDLPDLAGKVCIITGSNTGVGKEAARILYGANANVYLACRTESKARAAIDEIKAALPDSKGKAEFLKLDLADLASIKPSAEAFVAKETRLDVLINNAGVMMPPKGSKTAQGHEMQMGTNCLGHFLFTQLLTPTLKATAAQEKPGAVRVVWTASVATELYSVKNGVDMPALNKGKESYVDAYQPMTLYGNSKAGNYYHGTEYARLHKDDNIVSVAANPGNLDSDLYRTVDNQTGYMKPALQAFTKFMLFPSVYGAYTELFAGFSPEVTMEKTGAWSRFPSFTKPTPPPSSPPFFEKHVMLGPWGRFFSMRRDIADGAKPLPDGNSVAQQFWNWSTDQVKEYL
ncbi:Short-chain dehydrogenase, partial [Geosmithia morbida]